MNRSEEDLRDPLPSWHPYMCPGCRGLFRVSVNQGGPTACPLCQTGLNVTLPELAGPRKRRRSAPEESRRSSTWEQAQTPEAESSNRWVGVLTFGFILTLLAVLGAVYLSQSLKPADPKARANAQKVETLFAKTGESKAPPLIDFTFQDSDSAAEVARKFLQAETIEDFLPLIRRSEELAPIIRAHYRSAGYRAPGSSQLDDTGVFEVRDNFTSFEVVMGDYSKRAIAVEFTDEGPLVDWESWVGFCEVPWEKFIAQKLSSPTVVRVTIEKSFYFNFDFTDESKWVCFRLNRGPDEPALYGYCAEEAPFLSKLPPKPDAPATCILKIQFPESARTDDQVIITDYVQQGWVSGLEN